MPARSFRREVRRVPSGGVTLLVTNASVESIFAVIDLLRAISRNAPGDPPGGVLLFREPLRQAVQNNSGEAGKFTMVILKWPPGLCLLAFGNVGARRFC